MCRSFTCQGNKQPKTKLPAWLNFEIYIEGEREGEAGARASGCLFFFGNFCGSTCMYFNARENNKHRNMPHSISRMNVQHCVASNGWWKTIWKLVILERNSYAVGHYCAAAMAERPNHNMPRSAARQKMQFPIVQVAWQVVRLQLLDFPRILFLNGC